MSKPSQLSKSPKHRRILQYSVNSLHENKLFIKHCKYLEIAHTWRSLEEMDDETDFIKLEIISEDSADGITITEIKNPSLQTELAKNVPKNDKFINKLEHIELVMDYDGELNKKCDSKAAMTKGINFVEIVWDNQEICNIKNETNTSVTISGTHPMKKKSTRILEHRKQNLKRKLRSDQCRFCKFTSTIPSNLKRHLQTHTDKKNFACDKCSFKCSMGDYLRRHKLTHLSMKPYVCNFCDFTCKTIYSLNQHKLRHKKEKKFKCDECDFTTTLVTYMKRHQIIHSSEKCLQCDSCDYKCKFKNQLITHIRTHTGECPYACDKCSYVSKTKTHLKQHYFIHITDTTYNCDVCSYSTTMLSYMKKHTTHHMKDKCYLCDKCEYSSKIMSNLKKHFKIHDKEKSESKYRKSIEKIVEMKSTIS